MFPRTRFLAFAPPVFERRLTPRFECGALPATMNGQCRGVLLNISRGGALVQMPAPQPLREPVTLWVELPDRVVEFRGHVLRSAAAVSKQRFAATPRYQIAMKFVIAEAMRPAVPRE